MKKRCIYSYEFEDNSVYIGLTYSLKARNYKHMNDNLSAVHEKLSYCKNFKLVQLTDFICPSEAQEKENNFIEKYKNSGWIILNKTGGGSLGGNILKWNYEECKKESLKYNTKKDLMKNSLGCYLRINREKWTELFDHMINGRIKWTKENCFNDIKNYDSYYEYRSKSKSYAAARDNKWLEEICDHFNIKKQKAKNHWIKENCQIESLKYESRNEFHKKSSSAYISSLRNNWLDDICKHME